MSGTAGTLPGPGKALALARIVALGNVPFWTRSRKRRTVRWTVFALYTYVGVLLVLLLLENRLLFAGRARFTSGEFL